MAKVFDRLDIAAAIQAKAKYGAGGARGLAALAVSRGEAEIGIQQIAELLAVPDIDVVGPLPAALQAVTQFTAAVPASAQHGDAARALIDFLATPAAKASSRRRASSRIDAEERTGPLRARSSSSAWGLHRVANLGGRGNGLQAELSKYATRPESGQRRTCQPCAAAAAVFSVW
jgi:hypothetical protein